MRAWQDARALQAAGRRTCTRHHRLLPKDFANHRLHYSLM